MMLCCAAEWCQRGVLFRVPLPFAQVDVVVSVAINVGAIPVGAIPSRSAHKQPKLSENGVL